MTAFFSGQGDFILSVQGFALIFLAVVCALMGRNVRLPLAWSWLGAFAFIAGLSRWLELFTPFFQGHQYFTDSVWMLRLLALISLLEFGRRSGPERPVTLVLWLYATLILIALALAGFGDRHAVGSGTLLVLSLLSGGWAMAVLRRQAPPGFAIGGSLWMTVGGALLVLFLLTAFALTPPAQPWQSLATTAGNGRLYWLQQGAPLLLAPVLTLWLFLALHAAHTKKTASYFLMSLPFLAAALTAGWSLTNLIASVEDADSRLQLLSRTKTAAAALDHRLIAQLTGTAADTNAPVYAQVRERLHSVRQSTVDTRFVYLFALRGSQVVFLADSEAETSKDYSPPGQVYEEASPTVRQALAGGGAFLEGPLADRWGVWLSAFAPVCAGDNARPLALLGMDVAVSSWQISLYYHRLSALGLTLFVSLLILTLFAGLQMGKESAFEIASSEGRYRALIENAPEAVFVVSIADGRILDMNPLLLRWLGYSREEFQGRTVFDMAVKDPETIRKNLRSAWEAAAPTTVESTYRRKDGSLVQVEITQVPFLFCDCEAVLAYVRDITERRQNEERLRKTMGELERFNRVMVGRELRVIELKQEVNDLRRALGQPPVYAVTERTGGKPGSRAPA
jgi:PAS domain S-box-containing protein